MLMLCRCGGMKKLILSVSVLVFVSCAPPTKLSVRQLANKIVEAPACDNYKEKVFDELYSQLSHDGTLPDDKELEQSLLEKKSELITQSHLTEDQAEELTSATLQLYKLIKTKGDEVYADVEDSSPVKRLALLEVEDPFVAEGVILQNKIHKQFVKLNSIAKKLALNCTSEKNPTQPVDPTPVANPGEITNENLLLPELKKQLVPIVYSATKIIGVAYQSCEAMKYRAIASEDNSVEGIKITGKHSDGVGSKRIISDINAFLKTNFYLRKYERPSTICHDVKKDPLIYDYGGKPYTNDGELNLFKNAGSGTSVLGMDCSGYVFTALANAGLKLQSGTALRAQQATAYGSGSYKDPVKAKLDCLDTATFNSSLNLKEGDIGAVNGHVFIFGHVGEDPFGIKKFRSSTECSASKISSRDFDFEIYQSSPSKNGIGINRQRGADYLETNSNIQNAIVDYAVQACKAQFSSAKVKPKNSYLSIVRHKGTPQCLSATVVPVAKEACITECKL